MELNLTKTPVASLVEILNTVSEQPVDIDFTLPDYCPDIEKILRCKITPKIYNRNVSGGQLQVEGNTVVSVLYADSERGTIRACDQSLPFSATFRLNDISDDYVINTSVKCEYVNCRALSRRRLTVHGAFSLYAKVLAKGNLDLYSPDDIENVEFKSSEIDAAALCALCEEQFSVGDEIQITGKPPVELIIDSDVKACVTEYKVIPDKLMLSGDLNVKILYLSDVQSGKPEQLDYIIPFSQVIDCIGLSEDSAVCVNMSALSYDLSLKSDILAENPLINVDARISVVVLGFSDEKVEIAVDSYSTEFCSEPELARVNVPSDTKLLSNTFMHKDTISLENSDISEIIDFTVIGCPLSANITDGKLVLNTKANVNILAYNSEHEPVYIERAVDICEEIELSDDYNCVVCSDLSVVSVSYRLGEDNNIEIRIEIKYNIALQKVSCFNIVSSVNIDDTKPLSKKSCALTLYFADKGEKVWEIAKQYNTRQSLIAAENELSSDILEEPLMLLIPIA